jgi:NAD(P)H-dependent FMN reductase
MISLVGISGSTRRASFNSALLRAAAAAMPAGAQLRIESIAAIPLYNGDEEAAHGIPEPVARLKDAIAAADGLLLVTPEYNNSLPGVAKNAIDWLSRPPADIGRVFGGKPVAPCFRRTPGCRCSRRWARTCGPAAACSCRAPAPCSMHKVT